MIETYFNFIFLVTNVRMREGRTYKPRTQGKDEGLEKNRED